MNSRWFGYFLSLAVSGSVPCAVTAEPIAATYLIEVTERCQRDISGLNTECAPFSAPTFPLRLQFDDQILASLDSGTSRVVLYGPPSFSAVQLVLPEGPFTTRIDSTSSDSRFIPEGTATWTRALDAYEVLGAPGSTSSSIVRLSAAQQSLSRPDLDPRSMLVLLGSGQENSFSYGLNVDIGGNGFTQLGYLGRAFITSEPAPVPEPSTLLLFATGAAAIGRKAWKRRTTRDLG